jgi:uncharacterized protein
MNMPLKHMYQKHQTVMTGMVSLIATACIFIPTGCDKKNSPAKTDDGNQLPAASPKIPTEPMLIGGREFQMELAYTRQNRQQGLMFRSELPADHGMLFIFAAPKIQSFYMKNCLIDLDLVFLDANGRIDSIQTMPAPKPGEPLQFYRSSAPVKYAIELPMGTAARLNLAPGQSIELPDRVRRIMPEPD